MVLLILIGFFALNGAQQTASRLTWSFARDNALIFSDYIGRIDPQLGVPVWALVFNAFVVFVLGCVFLGSSTGACGRSLRAPPPSSIWLTRPRHVAFNAIVGTTLVLQQLSYAFPAALLMWQRRHPQFLPSKGRFNLGAFGWVANAVTVGWAMLSLVIYSLPVSLPATSSNMSESLSPPPHVADMGLTALCPSPGRLYLCGARRHGHLHPRQLVAARPPTLPWATHQPREAVTLSRDQGGKKRGLQPRRRSRSLAFLHASTRSPGRITHIASRRDWVVQGVTTAQLSSECALTAEPGRSQGAGGLSGEAKALDRSYMTTVPMLCNPFPDPRVESVQHCARY